MLKTCDRPASGRMVVLRRQPARMAKGQPQGGSTGVFEIICCDCGDDPGLDYHAVSPERQRIRGPYPMAAGVAAYEEHFESHHILVPDSPSAQAELPRRC